MDSTQLEARAPRVLHAEDTHTSIELPAAAAELSLDEGNRARLANALANYEYGLAEGDIVLTGSVTSVCDARPSDLFQATFAGMGSVSARFTA